MNAAVDTLTPAEAAVVTGVSMRDVHRVIDEHILPESFYDIREARSFRSDACVFIPFYFEAADRLTSEERQRAIVLASGHSSGKKSTKIVHDGFLTIDFAPFWTSVDKRLASECRSRSGIYGRRDSRRNSGNQGNPGAGL